MTLSRGKFRVRGDVIEVQPAYEETAVRIELFGDDVVALAAKGVHIPDAEIRVGGRSVGKVDFPD